MLATSLVLGLFTLSSSRMLDEQYRQWDQARHNFKSLVVEFEFEHNNLRKRDKATGAFRLLRTEAGELFASYRLDSDDPDKVFEGLLSGGSIYILRSKEKSAIKFVPGDGDPLRFLTDYFFPLAPLPDRAKAARALRLRFERTDDWYSYLRIDSKDQRSRSFFEQEPIRGVVALMRTETKDIPKFMLRMIRYGNTHEQWTYDIRKWRINPKEAPTRSEFQKPEDRAGWTVESGLLHIPQNPSVGKYGMEKY